jgi:methyl-accepting chemotaxis protein
MKVLSSKIDEIGHFASNVASAMEEQSYATADISQNIESASQETGRVRGVLEETVKSADATRDAARKPCFF